MSVERSHAGHQTRYELRDDAGLSAVLTYTADRDEPATWKILLPGASGTEDLYGTQRFPEPNAARLQPREAIFTLPRVPRRTLGQVAERRLPRSLRHPVRLCGSTGLLASGLRSLPGSDRGAYS
jgi:hypothetical protein